MKLNHKLYDDLMPLHINAEIGAMIMRLTESMADQYESYEDQPGKRVEHTPHESCSGFIPFTDGGWQSCLPFSFSSWDGSGNYPAAASEEVQRISEDTEKMLREDNADELKGLHEEEQNDLVWQWAGECDSACYIHIEAYYYNPDNSHGDSRETGSVLFRIGYNFDEYGREKHVDWTYSKEVAIPDLTNELLKIIETDMEVSL